MNIPESIHIDALPGLGQPLADGTFTTIYWMGGIEYALVALPASAELSGAWGEYGQEVKTAHADGEANTRAMAEAGSQIAIQALELGAFIPSVLEGHLLMHAKEAGVITDLREDRWYWLSTQFSANRAYLMDFGAGWQNVSYVKDCERLVRPVRKVPILR